MVRMESEAIINIIDQCEQQDLIIFGSDVLIDEINRISDTGKYEKVMELYLSTASNTIELCESITNRASEFISKGIKPFDSLHVASAEYANADVFLTTDKQLLKAIDRLNLNIKVYNPATWLLEVLLDER